MRQIRLLLLILCTISVLTVFASADMGPKPQLIVRVENAPPEPYYLDLLEEGSSHNLNDYMSDEDRANLIPELYDTLLAAIPADWHGCVSQGVGGPPIFGDLLSDGMDKKGNALHTFSYHGVPKTYRVLIAAASGEIFLTEVLERDVLQCSVTIDWENKTVDTPPLWVGYMLQFLSTLLPTLALEGLLLYLFHLWNKHDRRIFLLVNLLTQGLLALFFSISAIQNGVNIMYLIILIPAELGVLLIETVAYCRWLSCSRRRATFYAATANICSAIIGYLIMVPMWQFVVSIS